MSDPDFVNLDLDVYGMFMDQDLVGCLWDLMLVLVEINLLFANTLDQDSTPCNTITYDIQFTSVSHELP